MASTSTEPKPRDEPDLHPLYPSAAYIALLLSSHTGLTDEQKTKLVGHCLTRSCAFAEISVLQYLLTDGSAQQLVDLKTRDEDGQGLVSLTIHGFGADSDRDIEREECVRFLVAQGADLGADIYGWTPLHHAVLQSPPTLVSFLMTHGCSPFAKTDRGLTPLDIITAHTLMPGRDDVATLLEEAMRGEGWTGGRMEEQRRILEDRVKRNLRQQGVQDDVGKLLGIHPKWWGAEPVDLAWDSDTDDDEDEADDKIYTPLPDYSSMLVFSPGSLPQILDSLITNFQPTLRDATPANTLYMLARFACLTCDHNWLEDLIIGATDVIEDTFFRHAEDITCLAFWLYNTTLWLHFMQCDKSLNEACELLGSFEVIEEVINSCFVFVIRFAERRVDQLLDPAVLDAGADSVEFESEKWSILRPFTKNRRSNPVRLPPSSPPSPMPNRPVSPPGSVSPSSSKAFSSLRNSVARGRAGSAPHTPLQSMFPDSPPPPGPDDVVAFLTALHTFLTFSDINPALIAQLWSQVLYWTACEMFNRILTRKKYLCRSRAVQIATNLGFIEEWAANMSLPRGVQSHFAPVKELLLWLQSLSSITQFDKLVETVQAMKTLNPLQMRRAVRDYKYEVNEGRMTEECIQYLTQLQKDWERHRVKLGVEALRREMGERDRDRDDSGASSSVNGSFDQSADSSAESINDFTSIIEGQQNIDLLFDKEDSKFTHWEPIKPPQVLGELLDSRHMLPLLLPSDPRLLAAVPARLDYLNENPRRRPAPSPLMTPDSRSESFSVSSSRASVVSSGTGTINGKMPWRLKHRKVREIGAGTLKWVDGVRSASRWGRPVADDEYPSEDEDAGKLKVDTVSTPLTRRPSQARKGRVSHGGGDDTTPIEEVAPRSIFEEEQSTVASTHNTEDSDTLEAKAVEVQKEGKDHSSQDGS